MFLIVVGGHSRSVGKTSVVAGLISALSESQWTALKITQYGHGICSAKGKPCNCATPDHNWAISEERDRSGKSDTSRFLLAGAESALWVRTEQGRLADAMPAVRARIETKQNVICESNSVLKFLRPDLYLTVLDPTTADFKASAREYLELADALIVHKIGNAGVAWTGITLPSDNRKPAFHIDPPPYVSSELVSFVRDRLR